MPAASKRTLNIRFHIMHERAVWKSCCGKLGTTARACVESMRLIMSLFSMTQQIHFMRHGQALHNVRRRACGAISARSRPSSTRCARTTLSPRIPHNDSDARYFRARGARRARGRSPMLLVASPLSRALETAQLVFPDSRRRAKVNSCVFMVYIWCVLQPRVVNARRRSRAGAARQVSRRATSRACPTTTRRGTRMASRPDNRRGDGRARASPLALAANPTQIAVGNSQAGSTRRCFKPTFEWNVSAGGRQCGAAERRFHSCEATVRLSPARADGRFVVTLRRPHKRGRGRTADCEYMPEKRG